MSGEAPAYLFHHGVIRTMVAECPDGTESTVEALLVHGERIVGVGSFTDMQRRAPPNTQYIDLKGQTLLPGFIDPHMHIVSSAVLASALQLGPEEGIEYTFESVLDKLRRAISAVKDKHDDWILCVGFDPSRLYDGWKNLTVSVFDELFPDRPLTKQNPILVQSGSGHISYVNRRALELANIALSSPQPVVQGGKVAAFHEGEDRGQTSGILIESTAQRLVIDALPPSTLRPEAIIKNTVEIFKTALRHGNTMLNDAGLGIALGTEKAELDVIQSAANSTPCPRMSGAQYVNEWNMADCLRQIQSSSPETADSMFRRRAIKLFADGSNQGVTGLQRQQYTSWALERTQQDYVGTDTHGNQDIKHDDLALLIAAANQQGWQVMIHANGDRAIDVVLEAFQEASHRPNWRQGLRNRIEHCSILHDAQIKRMSELELTPSFLIAHVTQWGAVMRQLMGESANQLDRCRSVHDAHLRFSLHSDYTVSELRPLRRIQAAVTRVMERTSGEVLNPSECIPVELALKAQTLFAAWQCHVDDLVGSLEVNKRADLVILQQDPCAVAPTDIGTIKVVQTWVNGRAVYTADGE